MSLRFPCSIDYDVDMTEGWAYINYEEPACAANTLGKSIISPVVYESFFTSSNMELYHECFFFSFFFYDKIASLTHSFRGFLFEIELEQVRRSYFPTQVSRLKGLYVFKSLEDAEKALEWKDGNFEDDFLTPIKYPSSKTIVDSNWITYFSKGKHPDDWRIRYWRGESYPGQNPLWEVIIDSYIVINDPELKYKSLKTLEICHKIEELQVFERHRILNELGDGLSNVIYSGHFEKSNFIISPSLIEMTENGRGLKLDKLALPPGVPKEMVKEAESGINKLPDFRHQFIVMNGSSFKKSIKQWL